MQQYIEQIVTETTPETTIIENETIPNIKTSPEITYQNEEYGVFLVVNLYETPNRAEIFAALEKYRSTFKSKYPNIARAENNYDESQVYIGDISNFSIPDKDGNEDSIKFGFYIDGASSDIKQEVQSNIEKIVNSYSKKAKIPKTNKETIKFLRKSYPKAAISPKIKD
jgi:hypothetical protein